MIITEEYSAYIINPYIVPPWPSAYERLYKGLLIMERSFFKEINHTVTRSACSEMHLDDHQSNTDMKLELAEA